MNVVLLITCLFTWLYTPNKAFSVVIKPTFGKHHLMVGDSAYSLPNHQTIKFETLKFYLSNIEFLQDKKTVWQEPTSFHLYDVENPESSKLMLQIPATVKFNKIAFNLGIDSLTNVSCAMGGDLDPTKGMYWTWQSGYINFKLEGTSSLCTSRKNEFQLHLGGYLYPYNPIQRVVLSIKNSKKAVILFAVKEFVEQVDLAKKDHVMSPNSDAVQLSKIAATCFQLEK